MEKEKAEPENLSTHSTEQHELINYHYYQKYELAHQLTLTLQIYYEQTKDRQKLLGDCIDKFSGSLNPFPNPARPTETPRKKKLRRVADQIHKNYICQVHQCLKEYGSQTSLRKHIQLQHPETFTARRRGRKTMRYST